MDVKASEFKVRYQIPDISLQKENHVMNEYPLNAPMLRISNMAHGFNTRAKEYNNTPDHMKKNKPMDIEAFRKYANHAYHIGKCQHRYAKTMHYLPHWYWHVHRSGYKRPFSEYVDFMGFLFEYAYDTSPFNKRPRYRLNINGYNYFFGQEGLENYRAGLYGKELYINFGVNYHASTHDDKPIGVTAKDADTLNEVAQSYWEQGAKVLDIGCGTGIFYVREPRFYIGLDESRTRLEKLAEKTKLPLGRYVACRFEESFLFKPNLLLDLSGVNKYLTNDEIKRYEILLEAGGTAIVTAENEQYDWSGWEQIGSISTGAKIMRYEA